MPCAPQGVKGLYDDVDDGWAPEGRCGRSGKENNLLLLLGLETRSVQPVT
jgi:hypothetical protein